MTETPKKKRHRHKWVTRWAVFHGTSRGQSSVIDVCVECGDSRTEDYRIPENWEYDEEYGKRSCELCDKPHLSSGDDQPVAPTVDCIVGLAERVKSLEAKIDDLICEVKNLNGTNRYEY